MSDSPTDEHYARAAAIAEDIGATDPRSRNVLARLCQQYGIASKEELARLTESEVYAVRGCGETTVARLAVLLSAKNLAFYDGIGPRYPDKPKAIEQEAQSVEDEATAAEPQTDFPNKYAEVGCALFDVLKAVGDLSPKTAAKVLRAALMVVCGQEA